MKKIALVLSVFLLSLVVVVVGCGESAYQTGFDEAYQLGLVYGQDDRDAAESQGEMMNGRDPQYYSPSYEEYAIIYGDKGEDEYYQYLAGWEAGYLAGYDKGFPDYEQWAQGASDSEGTVGQDNDSNEVYEPDIFDIVYRSDDDYVAIFYAGGSFDWDGRYDGELFMESGEYEIEPLTSQKDESTYVDIVLSEPYEYSVQLPRQQEWLIDKVETTESMPCSFYDEDEQTYYYWRVTDTEGRDYLPTGYFFDME